MYLILFKVTEHEKLCYVGAIGEAAHNIPAPDRGAASQQKATGLLPVQACLLGCSVVRTYVLESEPVCLCTEGLGL